jgi:alkanesulfonate monooxygenase SsuD/methylene tetrahydromethanopterin reductase-like flavin-dependent oxidoreductase (luciferase family)
MAETGRAMKIGLLLPDTEGYMDGRTAHWPDLLAMAQEAERVGFDSVWVTDHFIQRDDKGERGPWECWSLLSALAATTTRVELGTLVLCTGFRNPAHLAKMADTVEDISNGRLILGIGAGWNEPEYTAFGYPFDHRVDRFGEAAEITSTLIRTGAIDFEGTWYSAKACVLRPRGPRPAGPPILIGTGSNGERMMRYAARFADQWNAWFSSFNNRIEDLQVINERVDAACAAEGRDPSTLARTVALKVSLKPGHPSPMSTVAIEGADSDIAASLRAFAAIGISHVQLWIDPCTVESVSRFASVLALLD